MEQVKAAVVTFLRMVTKEVPADIGTKHGTGTEWRYKEGSVMGDRTGYGNHDSTCLFHVVFKFM